MEITERRRERELYSLGFKCERALDPIFELRDPIGMTKKNEENITIFRTSESEVEKRKENEREIGRRYNRNDDG